jgi:EAL domain-containing protein (putative c-di-GMP-specific phosphodiesterase class I)
MNQGGKGYQETLLVDTLDRMRRNPEGRKMVHLRLSHLMPHNRTPVRLKILTRMFRSLESGRQIQIFTMHNGDLVIIVNAGAQRDIQNIIQRIRNLFESDPITMLEAGSDQDRFALWFDLSLDAAMAVHAAQELRTEAQSNAPRPGAAQLPPLTPQLLDEVQKRLAFANVVPFVRDQPVLRVNGATEVSIEFFEFFLSVQDLQRTAAPNVNLLGDRWLFQDLSRTMDQRMLETVIRAPQLREAAAISLNLNLESVVTPSFGSFLERLGEGKKVVVEVQAVDVFTNISLYLDVQGALRQAGHAILIDGMTMGTLRLIDVAQLKPDYAKVAFAPELTEASGRGGLQILNNVVSSVGEGKVILSRCESPAALAMGLKNGISLFQGRFLDGLRKSRKPAGR